MKHLRHESQANGLYTVVVDMEDGSDPIRVENVLLLTLFGSHLHGTTTPTSDIDLKAVYQESLDNIILGKDETTCNITTGGSERNTSEDIDIEFIELRKFVSDAMKGQTYALEMLHANEESIQVASYRWDYLCVHKDKLITSNVQPFIGYCVAQAKKYGLKGARLKATEDALEFLKVYLPYSRVGEIMEEIPKGKYVFIAKKHLKGQDEPVELLEINGKQFDKGVKIRDVIQVIQKLVDKYGARAHAAKDGIDWKAIGHAFRCIYELEELLTTGNIEFPLKQRDFLRSVKLGEVDYETIQEELPQLIERITAITPELPAEPDAEFWEDFILKSYHSL